MNPLSPEHIEPVGSLNWTHPLFDHLLSLSERKAPTEQGPAFIRLLTEHQLVPLFLRSRHHSLERIDDETLSHMVEFSQWNSYRILSMTSRFSRIAGLLAHHGIRYAVYKGPTLSVRIFSDIAVRQYGDIDLLVHPADLYPCFELLKANGLQTSLEPSPFIRAYLKKSRRDLTLSDDCLRIDLHQQIARGPRYYILPESIWTQLDMMTVYKNQYPILPVESELVVLAVHAARHGWDHYKLVVDFAGLLIRNPDLDWDRISHLIRRFQARIMFDLGISLGRSLFSDLAPSYRTAGSSSLLRSAVKRHRTVLEEGLQYTDMSMLRQFFRLQNHFLNRIKMALFYLGYPRPEDPLLRKFTSSAALPLMPLIHLPNLLLKTFLGKKTPKAPKDATP